MTAVALPPYAELHCLTNFTFLRGASHPAELVARARDLGYRALAITDECSVAGIVRAHQAAQATADEAALPLIVGSEFTLADGLRLVVYATDRRTYGDLTQLITRARRRAPKGTYRVDRDDVASLAPHGLALWLPTLRGEADDLDARHDAGWIREVFADRAWLGVEHCARAGEAARVARLVRLGRASGLPCVAAGDVHMHVRGRRALQDTLTAIRLRTPLAECGHALFPNGERHLRSRAVLARAYEHEPQLLRATLDVAARCRFTLGQLRYEYPDELVPPGQTPTSHLRHLVEAGIARRYPGGVPCAVRELIEKELALIAELHYEPYFLTVEDIVRYARSQDILCQGRGSAANSAVCYVLGITAIDPTRIGVLFERFVSRERNEPPDIDVDFEHQRRETVLQYIYDKYGRDRAALAATLITYRPKSAIRDVGKALGLGLAQVDRLAGTLAWWDGGSVDPARIREAGFDPDHPLIHKLTTLVRDLVGFPRHLSQHVGGFVIARDLLERMVPIENASMPDRSVIQWDKDDLDALGLLKVDCLALGMLSAIRRALALVSAFRGLPFTMTDIPREDARVYAMCQRADTVGVFQIESRAQQSMLPRLRPATFYDLVVQVAIVRPGPIQGGMVHPYLRRRQGKEAVTDLGPKVNAILERTLGVPIFPAQVMRLAIEAAGFTPGEADALRRGMAAWRRKGNLEPFERKLIRGMAKNAIPEAFARQVYQQILGFGEYGFPESHSASFALIAYDSAWLKCHEPAAFCAALLNAQPLGFYAPAQLVADARRHGVEVRGVDVTASDWDCTLEGPGPIPALRLGLRLVQGLAQESALRIVAARTQRGFTDATDLARRATLDRRDLHTLAAAGALAALSGDRHAAMWEVAGVERLPPLLADTTFAETLPALPTPSEGQDIVADYRMLGLTLGRHPLALLRDALRERRLVTAAEVTNAPHGRLRRTAGIVIGRQRPDTASGVVFVTLEDETGVINVIVWRTVTQRQRRELLGSRLLAVHGRVEREGDVVHLVAGHLVDLTPLLGALPTRSRDFH
ncbi:MAG: error-prone DNA polymerase [Burkholderiales bacterium]|nr:error-prone DNA polymerase [Burkholderiales bacterium]